MPGWALRFRRLFIPVPLSRPFAGWNSLTPKVGLATAGKERQLAVLPAYNAMAHGAIDGAQGRDRRPIRAVGKRRKCRGVLCLRCGA